MVDASLMVPGNSVEAQNCHVHDSISDHGIQDHHTGTGGQDHKGRAGTSGGIGTFQHLSGELFKMMAGVDLVHVPYRGAGFALTDLVSGQVQMMIDSITSSIEHVKAGRLRALGVSSATRWDMLPEIPAVAEFLPGYEAVGFGGVMAPRGTPVEIIERLNREINAGLQDPAVKARFMEWGMAVMPGSPADFGKFFAQEIEKWRKVVNISGAKAE